MKIDDLKYINSRIKKLRTVQSDLFSDLSESCIPSYCHLNLLASFVSWARLYKARDLFQKYSTGSIILDFGAGSGELGRLLPHCDEYAFLEENVELAKFIKSSIPTSLREDLFSLNKEKYDAIFCLDSLEHNSNFSELIDQLLISLKPNGILIVSGPTENLLYKLGRRIAGFKGDYHQTNIFTIENYLSTRLNSIQRCHVPFRLPLFSISVWEKI
jgi:2-polyprenyl-3-methyl-5-hydroxy-6-metoxy-1,4-benzoquinol methylase